jgi:hypothetical protein
MEEGRVLFEATVPVRMVFVLSLVLPSMVLPFFLVFPNPWEIWFYPWDGLAIRGTSSFSSSFRILGKFGFIRGTSSFSSSFRIIGKFGFIRGTSSFSSSFRILGESSSRSGKDYPPTSAQRRMLLKFHPRLNQPVTPP